MIGQTAYGVTFALCNFTKVIISVIQHSVECNCSYSQCSEIVTRSCHFYKKLKSLIVIVFAMNKKSSVATTIQKLKEISTQTFLVLTPKYSWLCAGTSIHYFYHSTRTLTEIIAQLPKNAAATIQSLYGRLKERCVTHKDKR